MNKEASTENSFKEKLKKELEKLSNQGSNVFNKASLEQKLIQRFNQIKPLLGKSENYMYEYFIIQNSLYFIKDNEFTNGNYFSLISNDI